MKFKCPACPAEFVSESARDAHARLRCMFAAMEQTLSPSAFGALDAKQPSLPIRDARYGRRKRSDFTD